MQQTWTIPFLFLSVMLGLYLFAPEGHRPRIQESIRRQVNFLLIAELLLIVVSIPSTIWSRAIWLRLLAWLLFIVVTTACARRMLSARPTDGEGDGPL